MAYTGSNTFLLLGEETTFNTEAGTITKNLGFVENCNSASKNNTQQIRSLGDRQVEENVPGNFDDTLSIDGYLNSGAILEMFFGQVNEVETTGDYTHTFLDTAGTPSSLPCSLKSYTLQENMSCNSDIVLTHTGCKANTCDITLETNNTLKFSSEVLATSLDKDTTAGTRTVETTKPLGGFQGNISMADTGSSYTAVGLPSKFDLKLNNNMSVDDLKALGSRFNQELIPKNLDAPISFTQKFANSVEFEQFLGGTSPGDIVINTDFKIEITNDITLGSGRIEFFVELENGQLETAEINKAHDGIVEATYNYVGGRIKNIYFVDAVASYF